METSLVRLEKAHTPFHVLTPSDIRTGSASGRTQPGYESHGGSFRPERRKVRTQRSELQSNSAGWKRGRTARRPASLPRAGPDVAECLQDPPSRPREATRRRRGVSCPLVSLPNYLSHFTCSGNSFCFHFTCHCLVICDRSVGEKILLCSFQEEEIKQRTFYECSEARTVQALQDPKPVIFHLFRISN